MGEKVDLSGCASEWDDVKDLRTSLRRTGSIFSPLPGKLAVEPSVDAASLNFPALLPVVRRLHDEEDGKVGMVAIGNIETQLLASVCSVYSACPSLFHTHHAKQELASFWSISSHQGLLG